MQRRANRRSPVLFEPLHGSPKFWRAFAYCLLSAIAFAVLTIICLLLRLDLAIPAFLYLIVIVLLSLYGSFALSAAFSLIGVVCLAFFFAPPIFSIRIDDPINLVTTVAFLIVAFVITSLVSRLKETMERQFDMRLEERVNERTRIARELHDTLLQSFQGLLLRFQTVRELMRMRPAEAEAMLESAIDQTAQAITEGRNAVQGLRASMIERNDLARAITTLGEEIAAEANSYASVELRVEMEGTPRILHPIVRDEVYRIAGEALRNAFRHARAKQIDERQLRMRVRDDGKGIDPKVLVAEGREGHFGLPGMRERAKLMGGKLAVWTAPDSGTEIELSIPASRVYTGSPSKRRSWFGGKVPGKNEHS